MPKRHAFRGVPVTIDLDATAVTDGGDGIIAVIERENEDERLEQIHRVVVDGERRTYNSLRGEVPLTFDSAHGHLKIQSSDLGGMKVRELHVTTRL